MAVRGTGAARIGVNPGPIYRFPLDLSETGGAPNHDGSLRRNGNASLRWKQY